MYHHSISEGVSELSSSRWQRFSIDPICVTKSQDSKFSGSILTVQKVPRFESIVCHFQPFSCPYFWVE